MLGDQGGGNLGKAKLASLDIDDYTLSWQATFH